MTSSPFGMPQAVIADLVEAARQHVLEEAAHELMAAQAADSSVAGLAFLVLDGDRFVVEANDPCVGKSDAEDVTGEVLEYGLFTVAPGGDVEDPAFTPRGVWNDEIGTLSGARCWRPWRSRRR